MVDAAHPLSPVFLSASVPDPRRDPIFAATGKLILIREAVRALTAAVLPMRELVFGGHPAISPLVALIANQLNATDRVVIFQSEWFRSQIPADSLAFKALKWTPVDPAGRERSLLLMRRQMIGSYRFGAGFFIGGMEGVLDEFEMFVGMQRGVPVFPVASTGAAARIAFNQYPQLIDPQYRKDLEHDLVYGDLFGRILGIP